MRRSNFFIVSILIMIGIFCWLNFSIGASSQQIIISNNGDIDTTEWICNGCDQGSSGGNNYIKMIKSTSTLAAVIPISNPTQYKDIILNYDARTYGGVSGASAQITISISNNGSDWAVIGTTIATSSTSLIPQTPIDLTSYINSSSSQIKFETLSAVSSKGVGLDNIIITATQNNHLPIAIIHSSSTGYLDEEIEFDASSSTDDEGNIATYYWDFGDSSSSAEMITQHIFPAVGDYLVTLTVTDEFDASSIATTTIDILPTETTSTSSSTSSTAYSLHDVVINEFISAPTSSSPEWIEFYNNTSSTIDLNGWKVNDGSGKTTTVATTTTLLGPKKFLVIYGIEGNLNNTGDLIILRDSLNNIIDQVAYGNWDDGNISDNAPATDDNNATAKNTDGLSTNSDKNDFSITITPTPGQSNVITPKPSTSGSGSYTTPKLETLEIESTTTPTTTLAYSDKIIINEILPRPSIDETNKEFIELKNLSTTTTDLAGWILADNSSNKYTFPLNNSASTTISSNSLLVIERKQSKIALNNSGVEAVKMYSPDNKLVDLAEYKGPVEKDYSYSRNEKGVFAWTNTPTPGTENIFTSPSLEADTPDDSSGDETTASSKKTTKTTTVKISKVSAPAQRIDLENISTLTIGEKVITQGVVSVEPGVLGTQIFYLAGSGIQIYCNKKDFPSLKVGDNIEVNGTLSEASGERRIKITGKDDIQIIGQGQSPEIHQISTSEIGEEMVGSLVKIKGEVIEVKGSYIYIDDGSEEAKVYIKASTGINAKDLNIKPGDQIEVAGIVSNSTGGYRLLPRYIQDINKLGEVKGAYTAVTPENSKPQNWNYLLAIIVFLLIIIVWLIYKFRFQKIKDKKE